MIPSQTLSRFIHSQEQRFPNSTGEFSDLLDSIVLAVKMIGQLIATAGFKGLYGYTNTVNVHGEAQKVLDEQADQILVELLGSSDQFGLLVSEEHDQVLTTSKAPSSGKYVVAFDPLDGSSNINSNVPVGTIFAIYRRNDTSKPAGVEDFFQPGRKVAAAGYAIYGTRTSFIYSFGDGVHGFTLDPSIGEFVLTEERIRMPERGHVYSANEGNTAQWPEQVTEFISQLKGNDAERKTPYSARYVGSLVADFDRNLRNGGIFLYPPAKKYPNGKLRLLYECVPLAFIAEQAGGMAIDGERNILDINPTDIHQRSPLFIGSKYEVEWYKSLKK